MKTWPRYSTDFIKQRYKWIAPIYPLFEILFVLPWGIRARAVRGLNLRLGDRVLEIGCGTGRNFHHLLSAIGPAGHLYGVDISPAMLARARRRCVRNCWRNVTLLEGDATSYQLPEAVQGVLFSLCYSVIPQRSTALRFAWDCLSAGNLVVLDAKPLPGWPGKVLTPMATWLSRATVLGDPHARAWEQMQDLADNVEMTEVWAGSYFICRATKGVAT